MHLSELSLQSNCGSTIGAGFRVCVCSLSIAYCFSINLLGKKTHDLKKLLECLWQSITIAGFWAVVCFLLKMIWNHSYAHSLISVSLHYRRNCDQPVTVWPTMPQLFSVCPLSEKLCWPWYTETNIQEIKVLVLGFYNSFQALVKSIILLILFKKHKMEIGQYKEYHAFQIWKFTI